MLAVGVRSEENCETGGVVKVTAECLEEMNNNPETDPIKGYQFKADGKTLDIPFS